MRVLKGYSGHLNAQCKDFAEADPGFPVGGGANPPRGRQHMILPNFAKNCMKLRKIWAMGGHPPKSATAIHTFEKPYIPEKNQNSFVILGK